MSSGRKITPLQRSDIPELSQFLLNGFGLEETADCFSHDVLSWKYFDGPNGPLDESKCSLVARSKGQIIGHIGMCHRQFVGSGPESSPVSTMHAIDWIGSPEHFGSGTILMLQAFGTCRTQYAVGGSDRAQAVFPTLGFEKKPGLTVFSKLLTPFHRLRTTDQGLFRKWAGMAKDVLTIWRSRSPRAPQSIELRPASAFTEAIDHLQRQSSVRMLTCQRDHLLLNYFLRYPQPGFSGWTIHTSQGLVGYAILKVTTYGRLRLGKIVDCWLDTEDPASWQSAVAALIDQLRAQSVDSVKCYATTPALHAALVWNGFAESGRKNVYIRDKQKSLPPDLPLGLSMLEADHAIF